MKSSSSARTPDKDYSTPKYNYIRFGYAMAFFALSAFSPFASVLFESKGFTPYENGLLNAVNPLSTLAIVPVITYLAERYSLQPHFMYFSVILSAVLLTITFLAESKFIVACSASSYFIVHAPMLALFDEHTMANLTDKYKNLYGHFRVYGAYSWLVGSLVSSIIIGQYGWDYLWISVVVGFLAVAVSVYKTPVEKEQGSHHFIDVLKHTVGRPKIMNFIFGISFMGFGYAIVNTFLYLYLTSPELNAPPILLGLCTVMTVTIEIPLFQNSDWLYRSFSDEQLFIGAVLGYVFRVWAYSVLPSSAPFAVLVCEPLHGLTFGCAWLSSMSFFKKNYPKTYQNSAVGIPHFAMFGLGPIFGLVFGGKIYEAYGPRYLFQLAGGILAVVGIVFWTVHMCLGGDDENEQEEEEEEEKGKTESDSPDDAVHVPGEE